jgi:hypothetical protein
MNLQRKEHDILTSRLAPDIEIFDSRWFAILQRFEIIEHTRVLDADPFVSQSPT